MKKRIKRKGVSSANVWVQKIPNNRIMKEYRLWLKRQKRKKNQSIRKSQQCVAKTREYRQCKNRTAHTNKCWIHLANHDNLRIKKSNIDGAGKGLFAWKKPINAYETISKYTGRKVSEKKVNKKYGPGGSDYALCHRGKCIDSNYTTDAAARFANDPRGSRYVNNADLLGSLVTGKGFKLKSNKKIYPGQEILTSYGDEYWKRK